MCFFAYGYFLEFLLLSFEKEWKDNRVVADLGKLDESKNSLLVETSLLSNNSNGII
jgi:hypothetical protein